jgi:hypothetical protein
MINRVGEHPEVFTSSEPIVFQNTRKVYPPRADTDGRFKISDLMDWNDFMDDVYQVNSRVCDFFHLELVAMSIHDAQRARGGIRHIQAIMPIFKRRHPGLIGEQQRYKDLCAVLCSELMVCAGHVDCIQTLSRHIAGSADKWQYFSRVLVQNNLSRQKDWRQAKSPAVWVKGATNNLAAREYWVADYAVDPVQNKGTVYLEEIAELPSEAVLERRFTQRSIAELEAAAKDEPELSEYLAGKIRYPDWSRERIWRQLGWDEAHGERVDRRFRRFRRRISELSAGIPCREYRPPAGISDASCTSYFEELFDGSLGSKTGVWQHRNPQRNQDL